MVKEETWSVSLERARRFFREQKDVEEQPEGFLYGSCRIRLTQLEARAVGIWSAQRITVRMEGPEEDLKAIYHRFLIQFLSAGG